MSNDTAIEELHPTVLLAASMWIDHRRWSTKWRIVAAVGMEQGGNWLSGADVGELLGINESRARAVMTELERDRVLVRSHGGGSRGHWCQLNPNVLAWRNVPWIVEPEDLALRVMFHEEQAQAATTAGERFAARARGWRRANFYARARADRQLIASRRSPLGPGGSDNRPSGILSRQGLGVAGPVQSPPGPGGSGYGADSPRRSSPPDGSACAPPPPGGDPGPEGPRGGADPVVVEQLRRLVLARSMAAGDGRKFLNGKPLDRLRELVAIYGPDVVRDAAERVPRGEHRVPGFLEELANFAALVAQGELLPDVDQDDDGDPVGMDLVALHDRADNLRRLVATCEQLGDEETAQLRRSELLECENAIEAINGRIPA